MSITPARIIAVQSTEDLTVLKVNMVNPLVELGQTSRSIEAFRDSPPLTAGAARLGRTVRAPDR